MRGGLEELEMIRPSESDDEPDELVESVAEPASACALRLLLGEWREPRAPESLQFRVVNSFRLQLSREERVMNCCPKCRREFAPQYKFCPVDGLPLAPEFYIAPPESSMADELFAEEISLQDEPAFVGANGGSKEKARKIAAAVSVGDRARVRAAFHLTLLEEAGLFSRLSAEVREVARESQLTWPELKRDPRGFVRRGFIVYAQALRRFFAQPNVAYGVLTGFVVALSIVGAAIVFERLHKGQSELAANRVNDELELIDWVTPIPEAEKKLEDGAAGVNGRGAGGGSNPKREKPGGGGGGGAHELKPHSRGKLPPPTLLPQINAPSPKPPTIKNPSLLLPSTIQVDPLLVQNDPRLLPFGDPKSQSTELSAGPGDGGGIGDGQGGGIGSGNGTGYGPGEDFNTGGRRAKLGGGGSTNGDGGIGNRVMKIQEVTRKAQIISRPEPQYTEDARKNSVTGEVMLRAVLSADGRVTNIQPMKRLPDGLTEKAIAAARLIRFAPAEKDGRAVSQYVTLVYNFNIY